VDGFEVAVPPPAAAEPTRDTEPEIRLQAAANAATPSGTFTKSAQHPEELAREAAAGREPASHATTSRAQQDRIKALQTRLRDLDEAIDREMNRPFPDVEVIADLKRQKIYARSAMQAAGLVASSARSRAEDDRRER
jgi:hypothetical protein